MEPHSRGRRDLTFHPPSSSSPRLFSCLSTTMSFSLKFHCYPPDALQVCSTAHEKTLAFHIHKVETSIQRPHEYWSLNGFPEDSTSRGKLDLYSWHVHRMTSERCAFEPQMPCGYIQGGKNCYQHRHGPLLICKLHSAIFYFFCYLFTDSPPSYTNIHHDCRGLMERTTKQHLPKSV